MTPSGWPETSPVWTSYTWALWKYWESEDQTNSINEIWVRRLITTDILMQITLCFEDESFRLCMNFQPISLANHVVFLICPDGKGICGNATFRTFVWVTKEPKKLWHSCGFTKHLLKQIRYMVFFFLQNMIFIITFYITNESCSTWLFKAFK